MTPFRDDERTGLVATLTEEMRSIRARQHALAARASVLQDALTRLRTGEPEDMVLARVRWGWGLA